MTTKNKINLSLFSLLIITFCLAVFLVLPIFKNIQKNSKELISGKEKLLLSQKRIENIENFKQIYYQIKPDLEKMGGAFVETEMPLSFISFLEKTAHDCGLDINISSLPPEGTKEDTGPSLSFQLNSASSFPNLFKFLEKLENSSYLIQIKNLSISRLTENKLQSEEFKGFSQADVEASFLIKVLSK